LRQVFLNVILNAIDAMPQAGTLTVRTVGGSTVALVEVQDSGAGIPAAIRARLFEPFFTSKPAGTGLGLAISAQIVTQHGGRSRSRVLRDRAAPSGSCCRCKRWQSQHAMA
jgi:signal transduction histidine kinase